MLVIHARNSEPQNPFLVFDKKNTVILARDAEEAIELTCIDKQVLNILKKIQNLTITEMDENNNAIRKYSVKVIIDKKLNIKRNNPFF